MKTGKRDKTNMPSFRQFIFSADLIDYNKPVTQEKDESSRVLLKYMNTNGGKLFKYILVQTNNDKSWNSMYLVSTKEIPQEINLYDLGIKQDEVINYDILQKNDGDYIINGVQINKINYNLDDPISAEAGRVPAKCEEGEYCIDSWLITYSEETGIVYWIEYDPICTTVHCTDGGGGNTGSNPAILPTLPTVEEAENILNQSYGVETYTFSNSGGATSTGPDIIKKPRVVQWSFFEMHIYGGASVKHTAIFNTVLFANTNDMIWKWESFAYGGNSQSQAYTLGGYPPCIEGIMEVNAPSAISADLLTTDVALHYHLRVNIKCCLEYHLKSGKMI